MKNYVVIKSGLDNLRKVVCRSINDGLMDVVGKIILKKFKGLYKPTYFILQ